MLQLIISYLMTSERLPEIVYLLEVATTVLKFVAALCGAVARVAVLLARMRRRRIRRRRAQRPPTVR
ncbi:hypothetical protein [Actinoplanes sp. L3-i22]|uniref:hypothetical protein n=1 Tax=Actinoplanes sp. L3-i22 TaxID=2836373 RepID=UPI001C74AB14|nr:hypothetical protein [Actinoplanes sp. L3-i22]BCY07675.1 hypothetical protein L3i22_027630 [Actinoplanes sp. L3-i22]